MEILHITTKKDWIQALESGAYRADSLESEGFIHCSRPEQVVAVANAFYAGQTDLVLLHINSDLLTSELRWEAADGDEFPHIYGPLNLEAVTAVKEFPPGDDGSFHHPS
jgi:uncharacterized protein (DUF952 family)